MVARYARVASSLTGEKWEYGFNATRMWSRGKACALVLHSLLRAPMDPSCNLTVVPFSALLTWRTPANPTSIKSYDD